jgi:hypothetical protein
MSNVVDMFFEQAATRRAQREGIPYGVALAREKADTLARVQMRFGLPQQLVGQPQQLADAGGGGQPILRTTPPLPPAGTCTDVRSAKEFLSKHHPGWESMSNDAQFDAAICLKRMQAAPVRAQLARRTSDSKPMLLLCLFPGAGPLARKRAYLAATQPDFNKRPYEDQCDRAEALRHSFSIVDGEEVAHGAP